MEPQTLWRNCKGVASSSESAYSETRRKGKARKPRKGVHKMERVYKQPEDFTERDFIESIIDVYGEGCEFTSAQASEYALPWYDYPTWRLLFQVHNDHSDSYPRNPQFFNRYTLDHALRDLFNCREETHTIEGKFYQGTPKWYNPIIDVETYSKDKPAGKGWELAEDGKKPLQYTVKYWSLKDAKAAMGRIEQREARRKAEEKSRIKCMITKAMDKAIDAGFSLDEFKAMIEEG